MSRRGWRAKFDRHLVDGLTVDERIAPLEGMLLGTSTTDGVLELLEHALVRIQILEAAERIRRLPFYRRWRCLPFYRRWFTKGSRSC